mmetsp:Transcript_17032/g.25558  ORF Transcript_17032/g.25558 Transcript_17032/m.25558 type:complete len:174 (+) Transcript_17032:102-623(+)
MLSILLLFALTVKADFYKFADFMSSKDRKLDSHWYVEIFTENDDIEHGYNSFQDKSANRAIMSSVPPVLTSNGIFSIAMSWDKKLGDPDVITLAYLSGSVNRTINFGLYTHPSGDLVPVIYELPFTSNPDVKMANMSKSAVTRFDHDCFAGTTTGFHRGVNTFFHTKYVSRCT